MEEGLNKSLNRYFEIIGLLYICNHPEFLADEALQKEAAELGINADEFNHKIGTVLKKYLSVFHKEMVKDNIGDYDFFFKDDDDDFVISIQFICANHSEWFEGDLAGITKEEIALTFANEISGEDEGNFTRMPSFDEVTELLKGTGFSSNTCWKLMLILQSPHDKIKKLSKLIHSNTAAYEKAVDAVQRPLLKLLQKFPEGDFFCSSLHRNSNLTPTLIYPALELVSISKACSNSFAGLFVSDIYRMQEKARALQKNTIPILKALSDSSKYDILLTLKKSPKYNLELAEELKLSAATISHHMNVLLTCRLVNVEKKDGRVYYTLCKETMESLIKELKNKFLG